MLQTMINLYTSSSCISVVWGGCYDLGEISMLLAETASNPSSPSQCMYSSTNLSIVSAKQSGHLQLRFPKTHISLSLSHLLGLGFYHLCKSLLFFFNALIGFGMLGFLLFYEKWGFSFLGRCIVEEEGEEEKVGSLICDGNERVEVYKVRYSGRWSRW